MLGLVVSVGLYVLIPAGEMAGAVVLWTGLALLVVPLISLTAEAVFRLVRWIGNLGSKERIGTPRTAPGLLVLQPLEWLFNAGKEIITHVGAVLGFLWSFIDFILVRIVAVIAGTTVIRILPRKWHGASIWFRYAIMLTLLGACFAAGWMWPYPYGLIGVAGGITIILGVARRWSWMERDRSDYVMTGKSSDDLIRVGFIEDLRDEALTALVLLFLFIPLLLRQLYMGTCPEACAFELTGQDAAAGDLTSWSAFLDWMGFFAAELFKSVPFVDWSEAFHVANGSLIRPETDTGKQIVFAIRCTLDLLLLASLLQAIQIAGNLRKQRAAWNIGELKILDPFEELREFKPHERKLLNHPNLKPEDEAFIHDRREEIAKARSRLLRDRGEEDLAAAQIGDRWHYNLDRLKEIVRGEPGKRVHTTPILANPEDRLVPLTWFMAQADAEAVWSTVADCKQEPDPMFARRLTMLASVHHAERRDKALEAFQAVLGSKTSSVAMREAAARELGTLGLEGAEEALRAAARGDDSIAVRTQAGLTLAKLRDGKAEEILRDIAKAFTGKETGDALIPVMSTAYGLALSNDPKFEPGQDANGKVNWHQFLAEGRARAQRCAKECPFPEALKAYVERAILSAWNVLDRMERLEDGSYTMGAPGSEKGSDSRERPQTEMTIPGFEMAAFTVTREEYDLFCRATGRDWRYLGNIEDDRLPADSTSWLDAQAYCAWLACWTGERFRLPTEAEWEYACRAGTTGPFSFGETISTDQANYDGNYTYGSGSKGEYREKVVPVDDFQPNDFGLYQMHGNVWEWCADPWHRNYEHRPRDGSVWSRGGEFDIRVRRGGSWSNFPQDLRSALRVRGYPSNRYSKFGFRVARTLKGR